MLLHRSCIPSVSFQPRVFRPQSCRQSELTQKGVKHITYRVHKHQVGRNDRPRRVEPLCNLFFTRNTRRVDVVDTGTDLVGVTILLERMQQFHVTLGELDGNDISVKALDRWEDIIKVRVAEVRVSLSNIRNTSSGKFERVDSPLQVLIPIGTTQWQLNAKIF